ncbi:flagellar basal-body MS-ring/collar protein FliF [Roseobacter sp. HKCCA0434]|uniref:flagellar basal-body MS-ring/collar protein FliF n=1 Tax=Roseobacter sp. HKCCA0434 TaxID=3079297 RepID=UPI002905D806|nr:flagellar basal-body MS-ring/collar protein FliF [Roseobacter sp. HKCCA0434]
MSELLKRFETVSRARQMVVLGSTLLVVLLLVVMGRTALKPKLELLYSGLEPPIAAEVLAALEADGVVHQVRGSAIYVPGAQRDALRLSLAGRGLPASGGAGYELLDGLSGFGTTSQMFDAAYARAQEGEIARTIAASPSVRSARVHLAAGADAPFRRGTDGSASVTVIMARGVLGAEQARAIRHMVASSVAGLSPESVSIIDGQRGVIVDATDELGSGAGRDREAQLRENVRRLIEARVGRGAAIVELSIETQMDAETITERVIDPDSRVAIHTDVEEDLEESSGNGPAQVSVASNLPDGDAGAGGSNSSRELTRTRERVNYEVSEVLRERVSAPGAVSRISVAVLVDGITTTGPDGQLTWQPRPQSELDALAELVRAAVGFDLARGDVLTIESLQFDQAEDFGQERGAAPLFAQGPSPLAIIQFGLLALVTLVLGLFVVRPMLMPRKPPLLTDPRELPSPEHGPELPELARLTADIEAEPVPETPLSRLRKTVEDRDEEARDLLRSWIDSDLAERSAP